ncbi:MAG TPA: hypothetical protein VGV59_09460 [Pyrinomonadaceae bacterium]|nr:hypothetical protein [Pyrinomonadaceae bacterium]
MERRNRTNQATRARKNRRRTTLLWIIGITAVVITLLVLEQVAILYALATLSITVLLIIVAFSDLRGAQATDTTATRPPLDDAAAISDGLVSAAPSRAAKNR